MLERRAVMTFLGLACVCGVASAADPTAREVFDAYMTKMKTANASSAAMQAWDFQGFMKDTFGEKFSKHTAAEQKQMIATMQKIIVDAMTSPQVVQALAKAEVKDVTEFKLAADRSVFCYTVELGEGKSVANQTEFRRTGGQWRIVDSGTNGAMLSAQLRGQYANAASQMTLAQFVQAMGAEK
jgi:ABC-type transporter MlaC component